MAGLPKNFGFADSVFNLILTVFVGIGDDNKDWRRGGDIDNPTKNNLIGILKAFLGGEDESFNGKLLIFVQKTDS